MPREPAADNYVGRFAPSPTGPLHFGSLLAAVASYLEARRHGGQWLLRIEDIDPPREQDGADEEILRILEAYQFEWDGPVIYQSRTEPAHRDAIRQLQDEGLAYRCGCSRKDLANAPRGPLGPIYPGTCREGSSAEEFAIRVRTHDEPIVIDDRLQGHYQQRLESESGDFIIERRDKLVAYQLAVVIDDVLQGVTDVVRGIDLLDSTPRQVHLQQILGLSTPSYAHIPVVEHDDGSKLSKLTGAPPIRAAEASETLCRALDALGQRPPSALETAPLAEIWQWSQENWSMSRLEGRRNIAMQHYC